MKTILSAMIALFFLGASGSAFAQSPCGAPPPTNYKPQPCAQQWVPQQVMAPSQGPVLYGAVAVSPKGSPRAWGAQSKMIDKTTALKDALRFCNQHQRKKGGPGNCVGEASAEWAAAIACGRKVSLYSYVSERSTAAEAATAALARLESQGPRTCDFQVLAHGDYSGKSYVRGRNWTASVACEGRTASATAFGAAPALNAALYQVAGNAKGIKCQVLALDPS